MKKTLLLFIAVLISLISVAQDEGIYRLKALYSHGIELFDVGDYEAALPVFREVMQGIEKDYGKEHAGYSASLYYYASCCSELGDNEEALRLVTDYLPVKEKLTGKEHPDYVKYLDNIAELTCKLGHYQEAINLGTESLQITEKLVGKNHPDYARSLNNLAYFYAKSGNYSEAIELGREALLKREKQLGKEHPDYATSLSNLSLYYSNLGDFDNGLKLGLEALRIRESIYGKDNLYYATSLNNVASDYFDLGNYNEAIKLSNEVLQILENNIGKENPDYASALNNLAFYYSELGNIKDAIELGEKALQIWENYFGRNHPDYALAISNLACYHALSGDFEKAVKLGEEALLITEKTIGKEHPNYAFSLNNLAYFYYASDDHWNEAIERGEEALQLLEETIGRENPNYANSLNNFAVYCSSVDDEKSIELGKKAMQIREELFGKDHTAYLQSCRNLAYCYSCKDDSVGVNTCMSQFFDISPRVIKNNFESFTEKERENFWNVFSSVFMEEIHRYTYFYPQSPIVEMGCDALLIGKGLLLSASQELSTIIAESGNSEAAALLEDLNLNRRTLRKQYEKPIMERTMNTDSLERVTADMERRLIERSKEFGDYTHNMDIRWRNVQGALGPNDVGVEFVSFPLSKGRIMYAAYVIKRGKDLPLFVPLCYNHELMAAVEDAYSSPELCQMIWGTLSDELKGVKNIYFSPSGELHKIAIESMPHWNGNGKIMSECFNIYRLSSTRELALKRNNVASSGAVLYGDIDFNHAVTPKKEIEISRKKHERNTMNGDVSRGYFEAGEAGYRGDKNWSALNGTYFEVENVEKILKKNVVMRTGEAATETTLKNLSGEKKKILHIATHGFYWSDSYAQKKNLKQQLSFLSLDNVRQNAADAAMTRSGLLFSGANITFNGKPIPNEEEDGVLTAQEVSYLDFRGMDLVVLSACQTGLGDVGSDGVFGLQRGFKMAGAQSIIMSLWEVSDNATQLMMTEFYKALTTSGSMNIHKAFLKAQQEVKKKYGNYNDEDHEFPIDKPHWAAFILLDAIDKQ